MASRETRVRERRAAAARRRRKQPRSTAFDVPPRPRQRLRHRAATASDAVARGHDDRVVAEVVHRLGEPLDPSAEGLVRHALATLRTIDVDAGREEERSRYRLVRAVTALYGVATVVSAVALAVYDGLAWILTVRWFAFVATLGLLIRWMQACYDNTRELGIGRLRYTRSQVAWGFFMPLLNLYRPYRALAELHRESDPSRLPLIPEVETSKTASYRAAPKLTRRLPREPRDLRFPIAVFWGGYLISSFVGDYHPATLAFSAAVIFALLGVIVAIGRRREELHLRMADLAHLAAAER